MPTTFNIVNVRGIAIRAHLSAVIAFVLLVLLLASVYFPALLPRDGGQTYSGQTYWSVAFISTLFLFLSTVAHELGHSLMARARGIRVEAITLILFGGTSDIGRDNERALDELLISVSGPGVSLVVALVAGAVLFTIQGLSPPLELFLQSVFLLNIWLGVFNLLPTLPLDGGRAVRGLLWHRTGDYGRATRIASRIGRALAGLLVVGGLALFLMSLDAERSPIRSVLGYDPRMVGLVAMLLAWFLNNGARNAYRQVMMQGRFAGVSVAQIMTPNPSTVAPWTSLDEIVSQHFLQRGERAVAVVRDEGALMGLVAYGDVRKVPRTEWTSRAAGEVMTPATRLVTVGPEENIEVAIRHMAERHFNQLPVVADGRLVGMIARVNILRFIDLKDDLDA